MGFVYAADRERGRGGLFAGGLRVMPVMRKEHEIFD